VEPVGAYPGVAPPIIGVPPVYIPEFATFGPTPNNCDP